MIGRRWSPSVYFVRQIDGAGPVKIGCSQSPLDRLGTLMCWSPHPLHIAASLPGDERLERRFHAKFRDSHHHHEWFLPSEDLEQTIADIRAGTFDVETLPPPRGIHSRRGQKWSAATRARFEVVRRIDQLHAAGVTIPAELNWRGWYKVPAEDHPTLMLEMQAFVAQFPADFAIPQKTPRKRAA